MLFYDLQIQSLFYSHTQITLPTSPDVATKLD